MLPRVPVQWRSLLAKRWWRRRRVWLPVLVLALYALLGAVLVPALARHYLVQGVREALGAELSIGELGVNPFLFRVEARGLALREGNGAPLAALGGFVADFELSSLFRWAWTFAELRLEQPELDLVREADGRINLLRVLAALPSTEEPADPEAPPPRLLLQQAEILGLRARFTDQARARPAHTELGPIDLRFDEIATLHQHRGPYTLNAALPGGATLDWQGHIGLHPLASTGQLRLRGFEPRAVWDFAEGQLALAAPRGVIDAELGYELGLAGGTLALRAEPVSLAIRDLALQREGAAPMLELREAGFEGGRLDLGARTVTVAQAWLRGGCLAAAIDRAGVLDWSTLVPASPASTPRTNPPPSGAAAPWTLQLQSLALEDVAIDAYDETRNAPLGIAFVTRRLALEAAVESGVATTKVDLSGISLELGDIALTTGDAREPLGRIARLTVEDARADLTAQTLAARRIGVEGLGTTIHRQADGRFREIVLASAPDPVEPLPVSAAAATWSAAIGELELSALDVGFVDESTTPPLAHGTADGRVLLKDVRTGEATPVTIDARLPLDEGGTITLAGNAAGDGSTAALTARLDKLSLAPLAPLVARDTTLRLDGGVLSTEASIDYQGGETPRVQVKATLGVEDLLLSEAESGDRFLAWRSLSASGIEFGLAPDHLQVKELRVLDPGAKIVVNKDRTTNLAAVMREPTTAENRETAPAAEEASASSLPISIARVRIDGATVDFADHSLVLPFAARIEKLKGVASGISSADNSRATLKFAGRVGEFGEAEIDGQFAPFDPKRFTDIEVGFSNITMTSFSPYSATFAGRTIAGGDLDLGLEYKVKDGTLQGDNRILLSNFRLGEAVESPDATELPLDLAIALLTDAEGHIDLTLPVNGDLGDPSVRYGPLVMQTLGNLLRGVVTAPFRALGSLFDGGDGEALQAVRFKSGSAELLPREQERLSKLAEALAARPQLGVELAPGTEAERDGYAARRLIVRRAHAALLDIELEPGEDPGPVSYDGAKSQRALEQLLVEREGEQASEGFASAYASASGTEPERVSAALALLDQGAGEAEYYRELYLHLVKSTPEPATELQTLGAARVQAIRAGLLERGVEAARVREGSTAVLTPAKPSGVLMPLTLVAID